MTKPRKVNTVLARPTYPVTKLSVWRGGRWNFATLNNPTRSTPTLAYFKISYKFGLVRSSGLDPKKIARHGSAGDYVARSRDKTLAIVKKEKFDLLFPAKNVNPPNQPMNSQALNDPKFLTKVVKESQNKDSDKIQVGNNTFTVINKPTPTPTSTPTNY